MNESITLTPWSPAGVDDQGWSAVPRRDLVNARSETPLIHSTSVRVADSGDALQVHFTCAARDIVARMSRYKDKVWTEGAVEVFLRPPDAGFLYEFQLSPIGTRRDLRVDDPGGPEQSYNDGWSCPGFTGETRIRRDARGDVVGWDAQIGIPWAAVGEFSVARSDGWLVGLFRQEYVPEEVSGLVSISDVDAHDREYMARLVRPVSG